jgi:uncharacterized protein YciI
VTTARRFAYIYFMKRAPDRVRAVAPRHASYWQNLELPGYIGGPFADRSGGLITFEAANAERAQQLVDRDPFVEEGLIQEGSLTEWQPE